jgi:hypothetical protein
MSSDDLFGDGGSDHARSSAQESKLEAWLSGIDPRTIVVVECGAGTAIPTVPAGHLGLACGALEALRAIDAAAIPLFST